FFRWSEFELGKLALRIHAVDVGCSTIKIRLVRARIDHKKEVSLFNDRARFKMNLGNVSRHARPNLDRFNWIQSPGKFVPFIYFLLDDSNDVDGQWRRALVRGRLAAINKNQRRRGKCRNRENSFHYLSIFRIRLDQGE